MKNNKEKDIFFMKQAIELAKKGCYSTHPNPRVGALIVKNNIIIGKGYHQHPGLPHAEYLAIKNAKHSCRGSTLYVNLEPCCHFGKTPPCSNLIIEKKIKRVVISNTDPNPIVSGNSIKLMRKHGIEVDVGILGGESKNLNKGFFSRFTHDKPYIKLKLAISLDGKIALNNGKSKWISSISSRNDVQEERALCSAILTSSNTILSDNPRLTVRKKSLMSEINKQPTLVILDSKLRIPSTMNVFKGKNRNIFILTSKNITKNIESKYKKNVRLFKVPLQGKEINLRSVMRLLSKNEINEVIVEAGAKLTGSLLKKSLIDEIILYVSPKILGHNSKTFSGIHGIKKLSEKINFKINDMMKINSDLKLNLQRE